MAAFEAVHSDFEARVRENFASQTFMQTIGAEITDIRPGSCEISVLYRDDLCHHPGGFHPGLIDAIAMNAAGYATFTISDVETPYAVQTVEHKFNLLAPPDGELLIARGRVFKPGRLLTVAQADVFARRDGKEKQCALAVFTKLISQQ